MAILVQPGALIERGAPAVMPASAATNGHTPHELPAYARRILFEHYPFKVAYGGRGSTKTWTFAACAMILANNKKLRIACLREHQVSLEESNKETLQEMADRMGLRGFRFLKHTIEHQNGSHIFFRGMSGRSAQSLKGLENVDICWVEQAEMMSNLSWEILNESIRKDFSEVWLTFNPKNRYDVVYREFVSRQRPGSWVIKVNYDSNKWFPRRLENNRLNDLKYNSLRYAHKWLGEPDDQGAQQRVLPYERLELCVKAYAEQLKGVGTPAGPHTRRLRPCGYRRQPQLAVVEERRFPQGRGALVSPHAWQFDPPREQVLRGERRRSPVRRRRRRLRWRGAVAYRRHGNAAVHPSPHSFRRQGRAADGPLPLRRDQQGGVCQPLRTDQLGPASAGHSDRAPAQRQECPIIEMPFYQPGYPVS